jgi:hypothetical protein
MMNILAVDGVPCCPIENESSPVPKYNTAQKLRTLRTANEDFEWYPTTPEIMSAMKKDIWSYLQKHKNHYSSWWDDKRAEDISIHTYWSNEKKKEELRIYSFLDIGAGDGRVLEYFNVDKKYGIEIATAQADDLIRRGVFLLGRNYWDVSLIEQKFGLVFSNPPYSSYADWVNKILYECNFEVLYLVIPARWKNEPKITKELERYEAAVVGMMIISMA